MRINAEVSTSSISATSGIEEIVIPINDIQIDVSNIESTDVPVTVRYRLTHEGLDRTVENVSEYNLNADSQIRARETLRISEFDADSYPVNDRTSLKLEVEANHPDLSSAVDTEEILVTRSVDNTNCNTIKNTNPNADSGMYSIKPISSGSSFNVYCDMNHDGGGWTLVMKSSGSDNEFRYSSDYWTSSSNTLNEDSVNLDTTVPTKLNSYNTVRGDEIRAEFPDHQDHQMVESFSEKKTPHSVFTTTTGEIGFETDGSGGPTCSSNAGIGRFGDYWYDFDGETNENNANTIFAHQCGRQQYGFNISTGVDAFTGTKIRWGWNWQNEDDTWVSQDAAAGIGIVKDATGGARSSHGVYSTTVGSQVFCCSNKNGDRDNGDGEHPRDVLIWIR